MGTRGLLDIYGSLPIFEELASLCMHRILLEDSHEESIERQKRLNRVMKDVVKKEIIKWLDA